MTSPQIQDKENKKFDSDGRVRVALEYSINTSTNLEGKGPISVGTTPVEISFSGATKSIIISSVTTNTGIIYIGKSDITSAGLNSITFLDIGESLTMDYDDTTNSIYVVASIAGQSVIAGGLK